MSKNTSQDKASQQMEKKVVDLLEGRLKLNPEEGKTTEKPLESGILDNFGVFTSDAFSDVAFEELHRSVKSMVERVDKLLSKEEVTVEDLPTAVANIAMITTLIGRFQGAFIISQDQFYQWKTSIGRAFLGAGDILENWNDLEIAKWQETCMADLNELRQVLIDTWG